VQRDCRDSYRRVRGEMMAEKIDAEEVSKKIIKSFSVVHDDIANLKNDIEKLKKEFSSISVEFATMRSSVESIISRFDTAPTPPASMRMQRQGMRGRISAQQVGNELVEDVESGDLFEQSGRGRTEPIAPQVEPDLFGEDDALDESGLEDEQDVFGVGTEQFEADIDGSPEPIAPRIVPKKKVDVNKIVSRFKRK
jgi:hypothetical protein